MADRETRKQLIDAYKERSKTQTGGVYIIRNTVNGKLLIEASPDIAAAENRFSFAKQMNTCVNFKLTKDWSQFGPSAFTFEVVETIEKNEDQTAVEFRDDLDLLKKMWADKFDPAILY